MSLAITHTEQIDSYTSWQMENCAERCHRLEAVITPDQCELNKLSMFGRINWECKNCGGLHNQNIKPRHVASYLSPLCDEKKVEQVPDPATVAVTSGGDYVEGLDALNEIIDGLYDDPEPDDDFDDIELDLDVEDLLALSPELSNHDAAKGPELPRRVDYQEAVRPRAVYQGKCKRCRNGYGE